MKNFNFKQKPNLGRVYFAHLVGRLLENPTKGQDFSTYTFDEEALIKWRFYEQAQAEALTVLGSLETGTLASDYSGKLQKWKLPLDAEEYDVFLLESFTQFLANKVKSRKACTIWSKRN